MKNEKMKKKDEKKTKKWRKKMKKKKTRKMKNCGFTRKFLDDFKGLPLLLYFFVKFLDDFHDFVSECVSFQKKINKPLWVVTVFPKKSGNFHWT